MEKRYILIEHGQGAEEPAKLTICGSVAELERETARAIYGNANEHCPELAVLRREGIVRFEGDPPVEWIIAGEVVNLVRPTTPRRCCPNRI